MRVQFTNEDRLICRHANGLLEKELDKKREELEALPIETLSIQTHAGRLTLLRKAIEEDPDDLGDLDIPAEQCDVQRMALRFYRSKLYKLQEQEGKLLVDARGTEGKIALIDDLLSRFGGQTTLQLRADAVAAR